jgi:hypothetical protein
VIEMANAMKCTMVCALAILLIAVPMTAFSKGQIQYNVTRTLLVAGSELKPGNYDISWKSNSPEAEVTFELRGKEAVKVRGKVVDVTPAPEYDSFKIEPNASGREEIKEIRFGGKKVKIVF